MFCGRINMWEIFVIVGFVFLILEMLVPSMFFLNLSFAGFLTALISLYVEGFVYLILIFAVLAILSILLIRPFLLRHKSTEKTGMEGKYIGKTVKVIEPVGKYSGAISIYDERWEARCDTEELIPINTEVRIVKYDSLILTVERI